MRVANRFSIAIHVLSLVGSHGEDPCTSEWMAGSIGVNAVVVRRVTGMLRNAGLLSTQQGAAGAKITRPFGEITMLDVLKAVEPDHDIFSVHQNPNPQCPVGAQIQSVLEDVYDRAQSKMEQELASTTLQDIVSGLKKSVAA